MIILKFTQLIIINRLKFTFLYYFLFREVETKAKKLLEKTEKSGQLSAEVKKCIQSASTLDDIETLAAQFKTSSQQSLATRARAKPDLEATAHIYWQPGPQLKAKGTYYTLCKKSVLKLEFEIA